MGRKHTHVYLQFNKINKTQTPNASSAAIYSFDTVANTEIRTAELCSAGSILILRI